MNEYIKIIIDLGLKENEAKVYLASLKLGQSTVGQISDLADVQRTFVYDILADLKEKSLISEIELRNVKHYSAVSVNQFKKIQQDKLKKFENLIPELKAIEKTVGDRPRVQLFEGTEGIKAALRDTLNQPEGGQIVAYATGEGFYETVPEFTNEYLRQRVKKKIYVRAIAPDNQVNRDHIEKDKELNRQTLLVPEDNFPFTNEIDIYGNKVAIMSLQGELLAVIIESESIAKTQRAIFELAWLGAEAVQAKNQKI